MLTTRSAPCGRHVDLNACYVSSGLWLAMGDYLSESNDVSSSEVSDLQQNDRGQNFARILKELES